MLVVAFRRDELPYVAWMNNKPRWFVTTVEKVRDGVDAIANTRDACAPQNSESRSESTIHLRCRTAFVRRAELNPLRERQLA